MNSAFSFFLQDLALLCFFLLIGAVVRGYCDELSASVRFLKWWHRPIKMMKDFLGLIPLVLSLLGLWGLYTTYGYELNRYIANPTPDLHLGLATAALVILMSIMLASMASSLWFIAQPSEKVLCIPRKRLIARA